MDTTLTASVSTIAGFLAIVVSILVILKKCGKGITFCFGRKNKGKNKDIEDGRASPKENIKMNPPESSSSRRRDSLIKLQHKDMFCKVSLMNLLRNCLQLDKRNSVSILSGHVDHFQCIKSEDAVLRWGCGCGWRNIQMLSSHLLIHRPEAKEVLYGGSGFVPDIASLQAWLKLAWEEGFDTQNFVGEFSGEESWIGTRECAALLRYFGLRANVVDFKSTSSSSVQEGQHDLTEWVWNYFSDKKVDRLGDDRRVIVSEKAPLYLHHDGHSKTIVGIQASLDPSNGMRLLNLLILNPHTETKYLLKILRKKDRWQQQIKRGSHALTEPLYQLCYVDPGIARGKDLEDLKTIKSIPPEFSFV